MCCQDMSIQHGINLSAVELTETAVQVHHMLSLGSTG